MQQQKTDLKKSPQKKQAMRDIAKKPLTGRQQKFCDIYLGQGCASMGAAALKAGYSPKTASVKAHLMLKMPHVKKYLTEKQAPALKKYLVSFDYKIKKLVRVVNEYLPDSRALDTAKAKVAIAAICELNKMQGDYSAEKGANLNFNVNMDTDVQQADQILNEANRILDDLKAKYKSQF